MTKENVTPELKLNAPLEILETINDLGWRCFEKIFEKMQFYKDVMMEENVMDDKTDRKELMYICQQLDDLASATRGLSDDELDEQFENAMDLLEEESFKQIAQ
jgi:hypothetical protein